MATHGSSRGLTFPVYSRPRPSLTKPAATMNMSPGGGCAGGGRDANPPPQGVHPRYVPKRGSVLKRMVRCFVCASPANSGGRGRVRPAPAEAGGDGPEQGK